MFFQLLGAGISAYASIQAGKAKEEAYKRDADRETFAAKDKCVCARACVCTTTK